MAAYHAVLSHFPIALLLLATLIVLYRAFSHSDFAVALDRVLPATLVFGLLGGAVTFLVGLFLIWDWAAVVSSPMARNHTIMGAWALAGWTVVLAARVANGSGVWDSAARWLMVVVAVVSGGLLAITGTLGGYLAGSTTALSKLLLALGWDVYDTYYMPSWALLVLAGIGVLIAVIGLTERRRA